MVTVNVKQLISIIEEADAFNLPNMSTGTEYLYNSIYGRLSQNIDVTLSEIDFDSFEPEDIDSFSELYLGIFEKNHYTADRIMSAMRQAEPVCKAVGYV